MPRDVFVKESFEIWELHLLKAFCFNVSVTSTSTSMLQAEKSQLELKVDDARKVELKMRFSNLTYEIERHNFQILSLLKIGCNHLMKN